MSRVRLVATICLLVAGCASIRYGAELGRRTEQVVFARPAPVVLSAAQALLFEQAYSFHNGGPDWFETTWLTDENHQYSYVVQVTPVDDGHSRLRITRRVLWTKSARPDVATSRDTGLEFRVLQRVDPQMANAISKEAWNRANPDDPRP